MIQLDNIRIAGISSFVPDAVIDNLELPGFDLEKKQKTVESTGIRTRHVAPPHMCISDYCEEAARHLMQRQHIDPAEVGALIFVTQSKDFILPATAGILQDKLGLPKSTLAFDINLGCSGFVYGLFILGSLLRSSGKKYGLLLVGDNNNRKLTPEDTSTWFLFGDCGAATLLENHPSADSMLFDFGTDGTGWSNLVIPAGRFRKPHTHQTTIPRVDKDGIIRSEEMLFMDGMEIFNFTINKVAPHVKNIIRETGEPDYYAFHQANRFLLEYMRKSLRIPKEKFLYCLDEYGNTSSSSIPLTLCHNFPDHPAEATVLVSGFGVGHSWASARVKLDGSFIHAVQAI